MEAQTKIELPELEHFKSGKVREVYDLGEHYLFVASDRISAFDCILPNGIPGKGHVLNQISAWWFERTEHLVPNHLVTADFSAFPASLQAHGELKGRSMIVKKAEALAIECVVRGYLIGSGWKDYQATGSVCGIPLREGYELADRLDAPIFTPATKAESGHDENISFEQAADIVGTDVAERARSISFALYQHAAEYAKKRGIIIADTKFEFGLIGDELILIDEVLTPDSSRFWPASDYAPGSSPPSFDKQIVRDHLDASDWDKTPPAPLLPEAVVQKSSEKYLEAFHLLTDSDPEF